MNDKTLEKVDALLESSRQLNENVEKYKRGSVSREEVEKMLRDLERRFGDDGRPAIYPGGSARKPSAYRELFCRKGETLDAAGYESFDEFFGMALNRVPDPRLQKSWAEGIPSDGGLAVPSEYASEIYDTALEDTIVLSKARVFPMRSDVLKIPATCVGDHSANLYGGVVGYWKTEGAALTDATPKYRTVELKANKLTCYGKSSIEWFDDAIDGYNSIRRSFSNSAAWFLEKAFISGSGAGEPLGILNSPALITIDKYVYPGPVDQGMTVIYQNLVQMLSRYAGSWKNAVWIMSRSALGSLLYSLADYNPPITGGGRDYMIQLGSDGAFNLLTRPAFVSEHLPTVGSEGDIILCDLSQYAVGMRSDMRLEMSKDVYFASAEIAHRLLVRCDGMPLWDEPMTLADGTSTVSPFVAIEDRS